MYYKDELFIVCFNVMFYANESFRVTKHSGLNHSGCGLWVFRIPATLKNLSGTIGVLIL